MCTTFTDTGKQCCKGNGEKPLVTMMMMKQQTTERIDDGETVRMVKMIIMILGIMITMVMMKR